MALQPESVRGIVLRTTDVGEHDRLLTVFTVERGKITVSAKGARSLKSRYMPIAQPFAYADLTFTERAGYKWLSDASLVETFFAVRRDLPTLALASYLASVTEQLALENDPDPALLRLLLNSLYLLCEKKYTLLHIKAVFELAATALAGFLPELDACGNCGETEKLPLFDLVGGGLVCPACAKRMAAEHDGGLPFTVLPVTAGMIDAMRHITAEETKNPFAFHLPDGEESDLVALAEKYLLAQLDCGFKTLSFFHEVNDG